MDILHAVILGVIEGVTEFLPISSTGHLILVGKLLGIPDTDFLKSFDIIIQLGAIMSVVVFYWKTLWNVENIKKLIVAFIPTGIIGLAFYKIVKTYLLGNENVVILALFIGGIALIIFEFFHKEKEGDVEGIATISYRQAALVGLCQSIAIIPGVSRSAATIIGGLCIGLKRKTIVEFSFLLAVPTMLAASGLDILKHWSVFSIDQAGVLAVGFVVSFVVAGFSIKFLIAFVQKHNFIPFGVYRIVLAVSFYFFVI